MRATMILVLGCAAMLTAGESARTFATITGFSKAPTFVRPPGCVATLYVYDVVRILRWVIVVCAGLTVGAGARAEDLQDVLFAACVASGTYRDLPMSESETCHCWASVVSPHLTPSTAKKITDPNGGGVVLDGASYIGGLGPVSRALFENCPGVQAQWDRMNRPTAVLPCKEAFKTRLSDVEIEWACRHDDEMGDAEAQYYMGLVVNMLDRYSGYDGVRPPSPRVDSLEWIRRSADQGYDRAQFELGYRYAQGDGIAKNEAEAARWYTLAANQGNRGAQLYLGVLYEYGRGVAKDLIQAYKWYALSAVDARPTSQAVKNRDYIAGKMTPAQLAAAQKLVEEWSSH